MRNQNKPRSTNAAFFKIVGGAVALMLGFGTLPHISKRIDDAVTAANVPVKAESTKAEYKITIGPGDNVEFTARTIGCPTIETFDAMAKLIREKDLEAASTFAQRSGCQMIDKGRRVIISDQNIWGNACVRTIGDPDCNWVLKKLLKPIE
jgi:hypothetical protein